MNKCKCVCHNYDETVNNDDCCANPEPSSFLLGYKKPTRERKTMNNLQQEIIKDFKKKFVITSPLMGDIIGQPIYLGREQKEVDDIISFIKEALETVHLSTRQEIAEELSKLPFHAEIEVYSGGRSERQVTYTTDIVHLENELKEKIVKILDKEGGED